NRTLLAALNAVAGSQALPAIRRITAHEIAAEFVGIQPTVPEPSSLRQFKYDRLNLHYYPALELAQLILSSMGVSQEFGIAKGNGFLLNMNDLFEKFVYRKLQKILELEFVNVRRQRTFPFDTDEQAQIRPDL